jgi:predicted hotdog family 3-hydroxylacyl-ACP dehydratase
VSAFPPVAELVPHAAPMLLLDAVTCHEPGHARCLVALREDSPFVEGGRVGAIVAIEYMAQAVAAYAGLQGRAAGQPPRIGLLLGTRELRLLVRDLAAGDVLDVDVRHVFGDAQLGTFQCTVERRPPPGAGPAAPELVAAATLNVFQHDGASPFPT